MSDFLDTAQAHPDISSVFAQDDGASMIQMLLLYAPDAFIDYDAAQAASILQSFSACWNLPSARHSRRRNRRTKPRRLAAGTVRF